MQRFRMVWLLVTMLVFVTCRAFETTTRDSPSDTNGVKSINVTYGPDVVTLVPADSNFSVVEGNELPNITCSAECYPACDYVWTNLTSGNVIGSAGLLSLGIARRFFTGEYRCTASNTSPDVNRSSQISVHVEIRWKPQIIVLKKHIPASIGDFLQLNVTFCSNDNTDPSVAWYRINGTSSTKIQNGTGSYVYQTTDTEVSVSCYSIVSRQSGYVTILTVANVKTFHFAKFSVQINNSLGSAEAEIIVSPRGPPETPLFFSVVPNSETASSVTLTWYPGFHSGANQTFHIQYRVKGTSEWIFETEVMGGQAGSYQQFNATISNLYPGEVYEFTIYAMSSFGNSNYALTEGNTIGVTNVTAQPLSNGNASPGAIIGGVLAAVFAIVIAIVILIVVYRKGLCPARKSERAETHPCDACGSKFQPYDNIRRIGEETTVYSPLDSGIYQNTRQMDHLYSNQPSSISTGPERNSPSVEEIYEETDSESIFRSSVNVYGNLPSTNMDNETEGALPV